MERKYETGAKDCFCCNLSKMNDDLARRRVKVKVSEPTRLRLEASGSCLEGGQARTSSSRCQP